MDLPTPTFLYSVLVSISCKVPMSDLLDRLPAMLARDPVVLLVDADVSRLESTVAALHAKSGWQVLSVGRSLFPIHPAYVDTFERVQVSDFRRVHVQPLSIAVRLVLRSRKGDGTEVARGQM